MPWPMFRHVERQAQHLSEMMERLGVDEAAAVRHQHGVSFAQARTNCIVCQSGRECDHWLSGAVDAVDPGRYCPNMAFFEAFRRSVKPS